MATKIQFRRDTATNWTTNNPTLSQGELGLDLTNNSFKIGDGTTAWSSLSYAPNVPTLTGNSGKYLTTNGTATSWTNTLTLTATALYETRVAIAASAIDLATGNYFTKTISATTTFTVSNVPASGTVGSFVLELTNGGSSNVTWWSGVKWSSGTAPTLTSTGVDVLGFFTSDGGTTWRGLVLSKDSK